MTSFTLVAEMDFADAIVPRTELSRPTTKWIS